jgi:diguanylate cyclase (GGDEF)-like protein
MLIRLLMIFISVLVLLFQHSDVQRILTLTDNEKFSFVPVDDRANGGHSRARIKIVDDKLQLLCTIRKVNYEYPYCEVRFIPTNDSGIDLSVFSEVYINAHYKHPQNNHKYSVRFQMRNFNEAYSKQGDENLLKYNAIEYQFGDDKSNIIPFTRMQVLTWWISNNKIPMSQQGFEVDNVKFVELATGNFMDQGKYIIEIDNIEFRGKWLDDSVAYLILVIMWISFSVLFLIQRLWNYRGNLRALKDQKLELNRKNILLESKQQELQKTAHSDALTGVLNRAGLNHFLEQNSSILCAGEQLSVLYLDLDHFKQVNDQYGHHTGDEVLINFANIIELQTRDSDVFVRWGGEEFVLVCPNTVIEQAILLAEKLRQSVESAHWPERLAIRMSVGVAQMHNESIEALMDRADKALYQAKDKGRNRVEVAP